MNSDESDPPKEGRVEIHHIKSNGFRVIYVDGGVGGIGPRGLCQLSIYSERGVIPRVSVREVLDGDELSPETIDDALISEPNSGFVREVEACLLLTPQAAVEIRDWLSRRIKEYKRLGVIEDIADDDDRS